MKCFVRDFNTGLKCEKTLKRKFDRKLFSMYWFHLILYDLFDILHLSCYSIVPHTPGKML